jgi:hypothetical protein
VITKAGVFLIVTFCSLFVHVLCLEAVLAQVRVAITPSRTEVVVNQNQQFVATVTGTQDQRVKWSITSVGAGKAGPGSINMDGLYTAPAAAPPPPLVTIQAQSVVNPSAVGTASVIVRDIQDYTHSNTTNDFYAHAMGHTYSLLGLSYRQKPLGWFFPVHLQEMALGLM